MYNVNVYYMNIYLITSYPFVNFWLRHCNSVIIRRCYFILKYYSYGSDCEDGKRLKFGDTFTISPCVSSRVRKFVISLLDYNI